MRFEELEESSLFPIVGAGVAGRKDGGRSNAKGAGVEGDRVGGLTVGTGVGAVVALAVVSNTVRDGNSAVT